MSSLLNLNVLNINQGSNKNLNNQKTPKRDFNLHFTNEKINYDPLKDQHMQYFYNNPWAARQIRRMVK